MVVLSLLLWARFGCARVGVLAQAVALVLKHLRLAVLVLRFQRQLFQSSIIGRDFHPALPGMGCTSLSLWGLCVAWSWCRVAWVGLCASHSSILRLPDARHRRRGGSGGRAGQILPHD